MVSSSSSARGAARVALVVSLGGIALGALVAPSIPASPPAAVAVFPPGDTTTVYGPTQLSTPNGSATNHVERFAVAVTPGKRYTLRLVNGAPNGSAKVTGGTVKLNGWETMTSADLASGAMLERVVQVRTEDTLFVTVQGPAGAYVTASVLATPDASFLVFGPEHFVRTTGTPVTETRTFSISATAAPPYRFCLVNGDIDGTNRVSSASIVLNGQEVFTQSQFNQTVSGLMTQVSLQPANTLLVTLAGQPGGFLDLCVTATDTTPPVITIIAPPPNLLTNDTIVIVSGSVDDQTPTTVAINGAATTVSGSGAFTDTVALVEGSNAIHIVATDAAGHSTDSTRTVIRDRTPPVLTVNAPVDGFITNQASLPVSGSFIDAHAVTVNVNGTPLTVTGTTFSGSFLLAEGTNVLLFNATDAAGNPAPVVMRTVKLDTQAPVIALNSPAEGDTIAADSATLVGTVTDANPKTLTANGIAIPLGQGGSFTGKVPLVVGLNTITLVATDSAANASAPFVRHVVRRNPLPPDPTTVASVVNRAEATLIKENTAFLYTGATPIQTGVTPATIDTLRAAVVRGRVLDRTLQPLGGAVVKIKSHPEFGQTLSREDGRYDLVVNGGGSLVLDFAKGGYLPAQRTVAVPWQDYTMVDSVILVQPDPVVTVVDLAATGITVARGSVQTDADSVRQATVFFEPGTQATLRRADGTTQVLTTLAVRATEFTVGANGGAAMPAELPPASQYTYAVQVTADAQLAAGPGAVITFSQPVPLYVENFLDFPVGTRVPTGAYNPDSAKWFPRPNGVVLRILDTLQGRAILDINGDGQPDSDSLLLFNGIDPLERTKLAGTYPINSRLWRVPIIETLPHDLNWPLILVGGDPPHSTVKGPCGSEGADVLRCNLQVQTAFQSVGIVGSPFTLNYASDRTQGNVADRRLEIKLVGATVPPFLERVDVDIDIAGRRFETSFEPVANLTQTFVWDGKDGYGRTVQATQPATVRISYMYPVLYGVPAPVVQSFGLACTVPPCQFQVPPDVRDSIRALRRVAEVIPTTLGGFDATGAGLGGFTLDVQHAYDPLGGILYSGDGTRRVAATLPEVVTRWAGTGNGSSPHLDNVPATQAGINDPAGIVVAPNGSAYFVDRVRARVRKVSPTGIITTVVGTGINGYNGDNRLASTAQIADPWGLALGPDGSLYITDRGNQRIRRVGTDDTIRTIAGTGTCGLSGDNGPAVAAQVCEVKGIGVGPDGSVYFSDAFNNRIRKIGPDGVMRNVAGMGNVGGGPCFTQGTDPAPPGMFESTCGEGIPATQALLRNPIGLTVAPDGTVYFVNQGGGRFSPRIRRIDPAGFIYVHAGGDVPIGQVGDGGSAKQAQLGILGNAPLAVGPDGSVFFAAEGVGGLVHNRVRRVRPDGLITTVVGDGTNGSTGDGGPARRARIGRVEGIAFLPDGSMLISDDAKVRKVNPPLPGLAGGQTVVASSDGSELYLFSPAGRQLLTLRQLTGDTLYKFGYNAARQLISVRDRFGLTTEIQRDETGKVTGVVSPTGYHTSLLVGPNGDLQGVTDPSGRTAHLAYGDGGLASSATDPNGFQSTYAFDSLGRLTGVTDPDSGFLNRTLTSASTVTITSPTGTPATVEAQTSITGLITQQGTLPGGAVVRSTTTLDDTTVSIAPDGTRYTIARAPDPRFGMQVPLEQVVTRLPSGLQRSDRHTRTVQLSDSLNPFSLTTQIDSIIKNGRAEVQTYERALRRITTRTRAGRTDFTFFDSVGSRIRDSVPGFLARRYTLDGGGRLVQATQGSRTVRMFLGSNGLQDSTRDEVGRTTTWQYDPSGQALQRAGAGGDTIRWAYDSGGNNTAIIPPGRPPHQFTYTFQRKRESYRPPPVASESSVVFWRYEPGGQLSQILRPDGKNVSWVYDTVGRPVIAVFGGDSIRVAYSATTGQATGLTGPAGETVTQVYDGSLVTQRTWSGPVSGTVAAQYDTNFRIATLLVNSSPVVSYGYDFDGSITSAGGLTLTRGALTGLVTGTSLGQVTTSVTRNAFAEESVFVAQAGSIVLVSWTFARDNAGRVRTLTEALLGGTATVEYTYDSTGRLATATRNGVASEVYEYDPNGNRLRATYPSGQLVGSYDAQDRVLTYGSAVYRQSPVGSVDEKIVGTDTTRYSFDALGQLRAVRLPNGTDVSYVYDASGRRVGKRINGALVQGFLYAGDRRPIAELDGAGGVIRRFVYASRADIPDFILQGTETYRIVADPAGSVRLVVNSQTGAIAQQIEYDAFGRVISNSAPGVQPFGFAGGFEDAQTGLVQIGVRFYDPETGRWISRDPILFDGGSSNLYTYAASDPVNLADHTGALFATIVSVVMSDYIDATQNKKELKRIKWQIKLGAACVNGMVDVAFEGGTWGGAEGFGRCATNVLKEFTWDRVEAIIGFGRVSTSAVGLQLAYKCMFGIYEKIILPDITGEVDNSLRKTGLTCAGGAAGQGVTLWALSKNRWYGPLIAVTAKVLFHYTAKVLDEAWKAGPDDPD